MPFQGIAYKKTLINFISILILWNNEKLFYHLFIFLFENNYTASIVQLLSILFYESCNL